MKSSKRAVLNDPSMMLAYNMPLRQGRQNGVSVFISVKNLTPHQSLLVPFSANKETLPYSLFNFQSPCITSKWYLAVKCALVNKD